ncbi:MULTISPECIES: helix-turn-helix domain-containing protein [unclassified Aureispira]|uniref:helix-turn-helix domain-containing protein n=1 Tax=unclassified Aureispira TaxID=2649989 RepID=UPI00069898E7|nr:MULTISPECIES: helix-turn-helix domain-containing protein [unclassified Aureispira]WMX13208.1 helix-turn-helix domain-containing protein [Aureispira sp. CCB-E]
MAINQRFKQLLEELKVNANQLAKELNISQPTIAKTLSGATLPSSKLFVPLLEKYPTVNLNWLISGKGEMFVDENPMSKEYLDRLADSLERENTMLRKEVNGLAEELDRIRKIVEALPDED